MSYALKINLRSVMSGLAIILLIACADASAQKQKSMQISGTAMGTNQQMGRLINVDIHINEYSTPDDQKALLGAFGENGSEGLANALDKMSAKGRIAITGTLGYDINYIRIFKTPDGGRKIRFVTDRAIRFGEAWGSSRSSDYALSIGEIVLGPGKKGKKSGTLMPVAKFKLNNDKEIEIETFQNPWNLVNIRIW